MSKYKIVSYLFIILGLLVMSGASYLIMSYASDMINAVVNFVTSKDYSSLQQCGVTPPPQFNKLKNEFATLVLPSLFIGFPALLIVVSVLMFLAGFYYHRGRLEDESKKSEDLEREMVHKIVKKMETEKVAQPPPVPSMPPGQPPKPEPSEEPEQEAMEEAPVPKQEPQELPRPKLVPRKKK